jgi:hypothetical protein
MDRGITRLAALSCVTLCLGTIAAGQDEAPTTAPAADLPPAAGIIEKAVEASGGAEAFESIKSMSFKIEMAGPMGPVTKMDIQSARPDKFALSTTTPQGPAFMGMNGDVAWSNDPFQGYQLVPEEQRTDLHMLHPYGMFFELQKHKGDYKTIDQFEFNGAECYKVRLSKDTEPDHFGFFDTKSGHLRGVEQLNETPMGSMMLTMHFNEYADIEPLHLFAKADLVLSGNVMGTMSFTDVTFNEVDATAFDVPDEVKTLVADQEAAPPTTAPATTPDAPSGSDAE